MIQTTKPSTDYELMDCGEGEKLERYGKYILRRPDPQALWLKNLSMSAWNKADAIFERDGKSTEWKIKTNVPIKWQIEFGGLNFWIKPTPFKHTGLFPEQLGNWEWISSVISDQDRGSRILGQNSKICINKNSILDPRLRGDDRIKVLNLFGYTGGATLAAAKAGAEVCHVDGSKAAIGWARENAEISGLTEKPIRWILDDALSFVKREIKRGRKYEGIIMDPPAFGHGPKGEMWRIEENFMELVDVCKHVLSDSPLFFLINGYASGYSAIAYENNLLDLVKKFGGSIETGELTIQETNGRLLPCGIFARWKI